MKMHDFKDRKIWLTGASSGIGYALAQRLINEGAKLVVSARNERRLNQLVQLNPTHVVSIPFDVANTALYGHICEQVVKAHQGIDIIILNAGACQYIDAQQFNAAIFAEMMQINFLSMAYSIEKILPALKLSKHPHIVAMSSSVAFLGLPRAEAYGASKAAVKYFFESLRLDLYHEHIPVSIIFPGFVKTPLTDQNDFAMPFLISSEKAAKVIVQGIKKYKKEIAMPWIFIKLMKLIAFLPATIRTKLLSVTVRR